MMLGHLDPIQSWPGGQGVQIGQQSMATTTSDAATLTWMQVEAMALAVERVEEAQVAGKASPCRTPETPRSGCVEGRLVAWPSRPERCHRQAASQVEVEWATMPRQPRSTWDGCTSTSNSRLLAATTIAMCWLLAGVAAGDGVVECWCWETRSEGSQGLHRRDLLGLHGDLGEVEVKAHLYEC